MSGVHEDCWRLIDRLKAERDALAAQSVTDAQQIRRLEEQLLAKRQAERALAAQLEAAQRAAAEVQRHWQYGHQTYLGSGVAALIRTLAAPVEPLPEPQLPGVPLTSGFDYDHGQDMSLSPEARKRVQDKVDSSNEARRKAAAAASTYVVGAAPQPEKDAP